MIYLFYFLESVFLEDDLVAAAFLVAGFPLGDDVASFSALAGFSAFAFFSALGSVPLLPFQL